MFRTINQRFHTIAGLLVFLFCLNYVQIAYFINKESSIAAQGEEIINIRVWWSHGDKEYITRKRLTIRKELFPVVMKTMYATGRVLKAEVHR